MFEKSIKIPDGWNVGANPYENREKAGGKIHESTYFLENPKNREESIMLKLTIGFEVVSFAYLLIQWDLNMKKQHYQAIFIKKQDYDEHVVTAFRSEEWNLKIFEGGKFSLKGKDFVAGPPPVKK